MKLDNNYKIIIAAVLISGAVYTLFTAGNMDVNIYLGIAAIVGGLIALYLGYKFLRAYTGRNKSDEPAPLYAELRAYEFPYAHGEITLFYEIPEQTHVKLSIVKQNGEEVLSIVDDVKDVGHYPTKVDTNGIANGTYFYEIITHNYKNAKKLIIYNK